VLAEERERPLTLVGTCYPLTVVLPQLSPVSDGLSSPSLDTALPYQRGCLSRASCGRLGRYYRSPSVALAPVNGGAEHAGGQEDLAVMLEILSGECRCCSMITDEWWGIHDDLSGETRSASSILILELAA